MFSATSYKALSSKATRRDMAIGGYRVKFYPYGPSTVKEILERNRVKLPRQPIL